MAIYARAFEKIQKLALKLVALFAVQNHFRATADSPDGASGRENPVRLDKKENPPPTSLFDITLVE